MDLPLDPSLLYLLERLAIIEHRVSAEVEHRRSSDPQEADERFRGLFVSELQVDHLLTAGRPQPVARSTELDDLLASLEAAADDVEADGAAADLRLRRLQRDIGLSPLDIELLLIALAPDVDRRFEPLYGYLNDDVSQRHATVGLALELCGWATVSAAGRARLGPAGPLVGAGLLHVEGDDRPMLSRSLRVPDRVIAHLLGDDEPGPLLAPLILETPPVVDGGAQQLARAMAGGARTGYLRSSRGSSAPASAAAALAMLGLGTLAIDLGRLTARLDPFEIAREASRDARLRGAGLVVGPLDGLEERDVGAVQAFADADGTVVLHGHAPWDPRWSRSVPVVVELERIPEVAIAAAWTAALPADRLAEGLDPVDATALFRLDAHQIGRAARSAAHQASAAGRPISADDLQSGARAQNAAGLQRLARRISPRATWDDLILPPAISAELRELAVRWRHRDLVLETWGMGRGTARGRGVSALFAGDSGTGKTLATEVIAAELGLDLYVVDLSTVIDKYIGETSKNLERIFEQADRVNGVLLFDEADALFGKRSAVSDAKDRHANVEVAYLLQRMETFDGVAILTTNLAGNLDEAFMRRLDAVVDFPTPDETQRRALWQAKLPPDLPHDQIDVGLLAERFKLSGSEIQNIVVSAAYRAAEQHSPVTMEDLVRATIREHRKLGRHLAAAELAGFEHLSLPTR